MSIANSPGQSGSSKSHSTSECGHPSPGWDWNALM